MDDDKQYKMEAPRTKMESIPDEPLTAKTQSHFAGFSRILDRVFPRHWSYFGFRRKTFLLVATGIFIMLLALILGLSVGLTRAQQG
jgi:hypothetical protein